MSLDIQTLIMGKNRCATKATAAHTDKDVMQFV